MEPEPQEGQLQLGMVTCVASQFRDGRTPYRVQAPLALVLDREDLAAKVIGCLCAGDVAVAAEQHEPWIMLPSGSFTRFPQMRRGRIKLQQDGWMISQHPLYGQLLQLAEHGEVLNWFKEGAFLKLPMVKLQATPAEPPAPPPEAPRGSGVGGAKPPPPREPAPPPPTPGAGAAASKPGAGAPPPASSRGAAEATAAAAPPPRPGPAAQNGAGGKGKEAARSQPRNFDVDKARALQDELISTYESAAFARMCKQLDATWLRFPLDQAEKMRGIDGLCLDVARPSLRRYGFPPDEAGFQQMQAAVAEFSGSFQDVKARKARIRAGILELFPNLWTSGSRPPPTVRPALVAPGKAPAAQTPAGPLSKALLSANEKDKSPSRSKAAPSGVLHRAEEAAAAAAKPNLVPVVFWGICDIKYDPSLPVQDRVRVLELGDGRASKFSGHGGAIKEKFDSEYCLSEATIKRSIMVDNKAFTHEIFMQNDYAHLRPPTFIYPRRYSGGLAERMISDLGLACQGSAAVLKLCNRSRGAGVVIVTAATADEALRRLLTPPAGLELEEWLQGRGPEALRKAREIDDLMEESCLHWWSNECPVFVAERCCRSCLVAMATPEGRGAGEGETSGLFDGTLRVAFALRQESPPGQQQEEAGAASASPSSSSAAAPLRLDWLGGYWKLPRLPSAGPEEAGLAAQGLEELHSRVVSSFNSAEKRTAVVRQEDLDLVYATLGPALPRLFHAGSMGPETVKRLYQDRPLLRSFALARSAAALRIAEPSRARQLLTEAREECPPCPEGDSGSDLPERGVRSYIERSVGVCCATKGNWRAADRHWQEALKEQGTNATAYYLQGCAYQVDGRYLQGVIAMQRCIALDPDFRSAFIGLSNCYLLRQDYRLAMDACEGCLRRFPDAVGAHFNLAQAVYQMLQQHGGRGDAALVARSEEARKAFEYTRASMPELWTKEDDHMLGYFTADPQSRQAHRPVGVHILTIYGWRP